jgi:hypothetical protein
MLGLAARPTRRPAKIKAKSTVGYASRTYSGLFGTPQVRKGTRCVPYEDGEAPNAGFINPTYRG